jgi:hypothetical protein
MRTLYEAHFNQIHSLSPFPSRHLSVQFCPGVLSQKRNVSSFIFLKKVKGCGQKHALLWFLAFWNAPVLKYEEIKQI